MKLNAIPLIAIISLVVSGMGVFGFLGLHKKLLNLHHAPQHQIRESDNDSVVPITKGTILLLLAIGAVGASIVRRKKKTSRNTSQKNASYTLYDLKYNPSRIPASMRYFGLGESHVKTLDELRNAICGDTDFIILTGDSGIGKSTLIKFLKREILPDYIIVEIDNKIQDTSDLFKLIADHTGINKNFKNKGAFYIRFNQYIHRLQAESKKILLIMDDVTPINDKLNKELSFLSNITIRDQKIIKILISGENISFSPNEPNKSSNSLVIKCRLNLPNRSEISSYTNYVPERKGTKNSVTPFTIWKLFDQFINVVAIVKQWAMNGFTKVLARIYSFIQKAIKNLSIKQHNYLRTNFSISGLFDSLLWNSVLSVSLFALALAFSLWYQGILPLKPDALISGDFQKEYNSLGMDKATFHVKKNIQPSERLNISAMKQLRTDQQLDDFYRQNELELKRPVTDLKSAKTTYYIQVGAFLIKENAINTARLLKKKGYIAKIVALNDSKGRFWHTVRIGEYASLKIASKHAAGFSNREKMDSIVLPLRHH
jgi:hypothetical protein